LGLKRKSVKQQTMKTDIQRLAPADRLCPIPKLALSGALKVLVMAPHPDDFDAIGVTMKYLSDNGNPIALGVARSGGGIEEAYCPGFTLSEKANLREQEQRRSLRFFGLPDAAVTFLRLANDDADDQLTDAPENAAAIESFLAEKAPDIVFMPHGNDTNSGHRAMHALVAQAARRSGRTLVALLNRDPKTVSMRMDLYMPFGREEADWKSTLMRFHDSQHQRNLRTRGHGVDERILDVNRDTARALSLAHEYAEAFEIECYNAPADTAPNFLRWV